MPSDNASGYGSWAGRASSVLNADVAELLGGWARSRASGHYDHAQIAVPTAAITTTSDTIIARQARPASFVYLERSRLPSSI
jgi:hypothetical protein